jgi:uncharacterized protein
MATRINRGDKVFLDTSFGIALSAPGDELHDQATELSFELEAASAQILTTRAVLLEIGNALSSIRLRPAGAHLLGALMRDESVVIEPLSDELFTTAFELFRARQDQEWGLVHCVSFVVMSNAGIHKALTADHHFEQAGFEILLNHE